jgi:membrane-associated phospholipid phosphatase
MKSLLIYSLLISYLAVGTIPLKCYASSDVQVTETKEDKKYNYDAENNDLYAERSQKAEKFTFKEIPRDLGLSLKETFWGWGALGFAVGVGLTAAVHPLDNDVVNNLGPNELFTSQENSVLKWAFNPLVIGGVSVILWGAGAAVKAPKLSLTGRALTESLFLSMSIDLILKAAFRRERPNNGGNFSFPSGHATAAFDAAAVLTVFYGWKGALPGYAMATLVSLNRLDSQAHFLSDVVMGAVLGSAIGVGTARFLRKDHPNMFISAGVGREQASLNFFYRF